MTTSEQKLAEGKSLNETKSSVDEELPSKFMKIHADLEEFEEDQRSFNSKLNE